MKTSGRILIILVAALMVVGATMVAVQRGGAQSPTVRDNQGFGDQGQFGNGTSDGLRGPNDRGGGGLFAFFDLFKNLFVVGAIFAVVISGSHLIDWLRKDERPNPSTPA